MKRCKTCRYWSDLLAKSTPQGEVLALCESDHSKNHGVYVAGTARCGHWQPVEVEDIQPDMEATDIGDTDGD